MKITGTSGDDYLTSTQAGDKIDGFAGTDILDFNHSGSAAGVTIDLSDGGGGRDIGDGTKIANIETLYFFGSSAADHVTGGALSDALHGGDGDYLDGGGGNDVISGGAG